MTSTATNSALTPGIPGFTFPDLHAPARLRALLDLFHAEVAKVDPALSAAWKPYADARGEGFGPVQVSDLLVRMAPHVSRFVGRLFGVTSELAALSATARAMDPLWLFKRDIVGRRVLKQAATETAPAAERTEGIAAAAAVLASWPPLPGESEELRVARAALQLAAWEKKADPVPVQALRAALRIAPDVPDPQVAARALDLLASWLRHRHHAGELRDWASFRQPETLHFPDGLVELVRADPARPERITGPEHRRRRRDGFALTDPRMDGTFAMGETHYCIYCHSRDKDSCSKGFREKDGKPKPNPLGVPLAGCPLEEKISEAQFLKKAGDALGALACVIIDNPMCPGTGHRICNDCMKACIFQKQEPVNIPEIETNTLTDVLDLPWGFEIYSFLTRWNPLNVRRPCALPYNGRNVLVVGLGPAGYTLAHFLVNEGFGVAGIDGLKLEPLPEDLVGAPGRPFIPLRNWRDHLEPLDNRVLLGFGGVSEYGITVRWDKNFLKVLYLTLLRRDLFRAWGGVRFGGTLTLEDAWELGFHHVAIAAGAGRPTIIDMKNNLCRGVRKASDFLMALQLTGAYKESSLANLQLRLPAMVIGGGLTAIDATTEAAAYYPRQVEKFLDRWERLIVAGTTEEALFARYDEEERGIAREFLEHGIAVRAEREAAKLEGRPPDFMKLVNAWGGVSMAYRKSIQDSPAYRINHEEVIKALEEGITIVEKMNPVECHTDRFGSLEAVTFEKSREVDGRWVDTKEFVKLPARSLFVAAGTTPNIIYEKERPGTFLLDAKKKFFQAHRPVDGKLVPATGGFFTSYEKDGRRVTFYGDNHPTYAGSVVKAMASARDGYPHVVGEFAREIAALTPAGQPERDAAWKRLVETLEDGLTARVHDVVRLTPTIVEVFVRAPMAVRHFEPGQFYRLQNYEVDAPILEGTKLLTEGLALTGAWTDKSRGLLSTIILEMGGSSRQVALFRKGQRVVLMGPTGTPTHIPRGEEVILAGGGLGNAVLFSIGKALRSAGNRVLYFAAYRSAADVYHVDDIEQASDQIIWSVDGGDQIPARRPGDRSFRGNVVQAMLAYAKGEFGDGAFPLSCGKRLIAIGSDRMMAAVTRARKEVLAPYLKEHIAIGSINSSMQCMMKEVCAQCLQKHVDPVTGREAAPVFSCFNQDQEMDRVDWKNLNDRLKTNSVQEKLANAWLDMIFAKHELART
ncbi:MAG: FAD-dependent oxidoreductase [Candidatus Brocadiae bacterium]|nr:FAD-dependent oxidoreductase [Candidatus Brocadiia bacterium]